VLLDPGLHPLDGDRHGGIRRGSGRSRGRDREQDHTEERGGAPHRCLSHDCTSPLEGEAKPGPRGGEPVESERPFKYCKAVRTRRTRSRDQSAETRIDILKSAAKAFRRLGYHGATVEEIAAALHMNKGNLYYYFKNKEEILYACHQYSLDRLLQLLAEAEDTREKADAKLRRIIHGAVHLILDELHGTALFLDLEALTPAHLKAVIVQRDRFDHGLRRIIEEGATEGSFRALDRHAHDASTQAKLLSFAILGAINWIPRWYNPTGSASSEEIARQFCEYLIGGLR
jgi:AcrR family transcriptional regulator